jgi:hypothetical protein
VSVSDGSAEADVAAVAVTKRVDESVIDAVAVESGSGVINRSNPPVTVRTASKFK